MSAFLEGLGKVFGKVADQVQGRIERLKNERERLLNERHKLLTTKPFPANAADRINRIDVRVREIDNILAQTKVRSHRLRSLIDVIVQSELFLTK